jgi:hypothetical protein
VAEGEGYEGGSRAWIRSNGVTRYASVQPQAFEASLNFMVVSALQLP